MNLSLIYFAATRDLVGLPEEKLELSEEQATVGDLVAFLLARHPRLSMEGVRVAVNEEFADRNMVLKDGDIVALIPPVSGG